MAQGDTSPLHILCLDGGGVRVLSEVFILENLMNRIRFQEAKRQMKRLSDIPEPLPWKYFDLICGTSTGGILAIMLGRLKMSVSASKEFLKKLSEAIFEKEDPGRYRFNTTDFERELSRLVTEVAGLDANEPLEDVDDDCSTFVVAKGRTTLDSATLFKTYRVDGTEKECTIVQAARATSATPAYFEPVKIESMYYVDGGLGYNNPAEEAVREAARIWKSKRPIGCLVSIGAGLQSPVQEDPEYLDKLAEKLGEGTAAAIKGKDPNLAEKLSTGDYCTELAKDCEVTHRNLAESQVLNRNQYFRFNVDRGLTEELLHESKNTGLIFQRTDAYLAHPDQKKDLESCVELLYNTLPSTNARLSNTISSTDALEELEMHAR